MNEKELIVFRAELRAKLERAIVGDEDPGQELPQDLPLDVIVAELGSILASLVALNPSLRNREERRAAVERLAKGIELQVESFVTLPNWPFANMAPQVG